MKLRVLLVNLPGEQVRGGAEVVVDQTARLLRAAGHAVEVLDHAGEIPAPAMRLDEGTAIRAALRVVDRWQPDIVHLHNLASRRLLAALARRPGTVRTLHDSGACCPTGKCLRPDGGVCTAFDCARACRLWLAPRRWLRFARIRALNRRLPLLAPSGWLAAAGRRAGLGRVTVLPHAFEDRAEAPSAGEPLALYVGRLESAKGIGEFLAVARALPPHCRIAVSGDGDAAPEVEAALREFGGRLEWDAGSDPERRRSLLRRARAVVMPSLQPESFGLVGFLAAQYGKPVVAYDCGGIREWLAAEQLVRRGDRAALAAAVAALLDDAGRSAQVGWAARDEYRRRFSEAQYLDRLLAFYARERGR